MKISNELLPDWLMASIQCTSTMAKLWIWFFDVTLAKRYVFALSEYHSTYNAFFITLLTRSKNNIETNQLGGDIVASTERTAFSTVLLTKIERLWPV